MSKPDPILSVQGLYRVYKSGDSLLHVLKNAQFDVWAGEMVGLVGPSGSGKSTLIHAAALLEKPNAGEIYINSQACLALSDHHRTAIRRETIGIVYQFHHLQREFTALENVIIPQMFAGQSKAMARQQAQHFLALMGLSGRIGHKPSQMSGGEQQRVAIARAMANRPQIIMADEPTGNLDPQNSEMVFQSLHNLTRRENVAVLVATHNMRLMKFMDRVLTLKEGEIVPFAGD